MDFIAPRRAILRLVGIVVLVASPVSAAPGLSEYTIFGENGVVIGVDSTITGLVGARNNDPMAGNAAIRLNGNAAIDGDARSGGNVNLQNNATITGTLYRPMGTSLTLNSGATVGTDDFPSDPELPVLPTPTALTCPTGGLPQTGMNGESLTLMPGSYGDLSYGSGFTLTLDGAGDYFFDSITTGNGALIIVTQPGTNVYVCDAATFGSVEVQTPSTTSCDLSFEVQGQGDNAFRAGQSSNWLGNVYTPFGEIHYGGGSCCSEFQGRFQGDQVDIEHAIQGASLICGPDDEQEFESGKDATILHGLMNENNGANKTLRLGYQIRAIAGFDVSNVNFANVVSAKLIFTISNNGSDKKPFSPSGGWPSTGGNVYVARVADGFGTWAEGNGNNFPKKNNPRGSGLGITWQCATDNEIANKEADCAGTFKWGMGGKLVQGTPRGPVVHLNNMPDGSKIEFDVTADVQAGLGPMDTSTMSWFVERVGPGKAAYYSREGAAAAGNPSYAPTLQIEFQ